MKKVVKVIMIICLLFSSNVYALKAGDVIYDKDSGDTDVKTALDELYKDYYNKRDEINRINSIGNASASDILSGKTAYVNGETITGTCPIKDEATYIPSISDQIITGGQYLGGNQIIKGDANLLANNIAFGKAIFGVSGSYTSDANATASEILSGKTAYVNGQKVTGSIANKIAATYTPSSKDQTIAAGQYLSGLVTIKGDPNLIAGNIAKGKTIFGVVGNYTSDANATAAQILSGRTAYVNGAKVTGTIPSKIAATYIPTTTDQSIEAGQYLGEAQTIKGDSNLISDNIKSGTTIFGVEGNPNVVNTAEETNPASSANILSGKVAYVNGTKITGTIGSKAAVTYTPSSKDQTIAAGQYLGGIQTIKGDANLVKDNIRSGVTIFGVTGNTNVVNTAEGTSPAAAGNILSGKVAYVNGTKITGSIGSKAAATYTPSSKNQTIAASQYLSGVQTIKGDANLVAGNIAKGKTIFGVSGSYTSDATAAAGNILSGKTAYVNGAKVTGTIPSKAAATYTPTTSDQSIAAGQYLGGAQTIKGDVNLITNNIRSGVTIFGVEGNPNVVNTAEGTNPAGAGNILSGKIAYVNGTKVTGTIGSKGAATYTPNTKNQTIAAGQYLSGVQTIKGDANLVAGNIAKGKTIFGVAGTYTSDANAVAGNILSGKTAYVNGAKVTGTIGSKEAATYTPNTKDQTIAASQYLSGVQTIKGDANLLAGNIAKGKTIFGVAGTYTSDANAVAGNIVSGKTAYVNGAKVTGTMTDQGAKTASLTPGGSYTIPAGYHNGSGKVTAKSFVVKQIAAEADSGMGSSPPTPSDSVSYTIPAGAINATVYYAGYAVDYYGGNSGLCRIYVNGVLKDNRDLTGNTYAFRATMVNKSFSANAGDVIKVETTASGNAGTFMQAVIVYFQ